MMTVYIVRVHFLRSRHGINRLVHDSYPRLGSRRKPRVLADAAGQRSVGEVIRVLAKEPERLEEVVGAREWRAEACPPGAQAQPCPDVSSSADSGSSRPRKYSGAVEAGRDGDAAAGGEPCAACRSGTGDTGGAAGPTGASSLERRRLRSDHSGPGGSLTTPGSTNK